MNARSLPDSIGAAPVAAVRWGGLADTVSQDCLEPDNLDVKTADLLHRLDELAACSGLDEVAQFLDSPRGFSVLERNYLMSPLVDQIYACLTVPLKRRRFPYQIHGLGVTVTMSCRLSWEWLTILPILFLFGQIAPAWLCL